MQPSGQPRLRSARLLLLISWTSLLNFIINLTSLLNFIINLTSLINFIINSTSLQNFIINLTSLINFIINLTSLLNFIINSTSLLNFIIYLTYLISFVWFIPQTLITLDFLLKRSCHPSMYWAELSPLNYGNLEGSDTWRVRFFPKLCLGYFLMAYQPSWII